MKLHPSYYGNSLACLGTQARGAIAVTVVVGKVVHLCGNLHERAWETTNGYLL